ncbi:hypothetical protein CN151_34135 [Sinorhizobium meliloti]|uniref:hypothetical protein n=1 Tax=Rhizobium meliloti TaxID=382 RepID=UPI0002A5B739|nr:hypothetical protein [Sinorhizobium meliloti]AGA08713.1 hypothetical protein C770_GR4pB244 [Sinorhizobium meliloti GR4]RVK90600.1 hypothetical protein CN151_34135 [Sinorhizobium meliloti]RVM82814.1 hypothetical protein CN119_33735 [Sinorhizobium meliloti]RVM99599.1 hypothetical protein CN112_34585 [Sinorhizobium meliloti]
MSKASRLQNEATIASAAIAAESRDFDRISIRLVIYGPGYMRLTQPGPVAPLIKRKPSDREWRDPMSMPIPTAPPLRTSLMVTRKASPFNICPAIRLCFTMLVRTWWQSGRRPHRH